MKLFGLESCYISGSDQKFCWKAMAEYLWLHAAVFLSYKGLQKTDFTSVLCKTTRNALSPVLVPLKL